MIMSFQTFFPMQQTLYQYSFFNVFNLHVSSKVSVVSDLNSQQDQRLVTCQNDLSRVMPCAFAAFAVPCAQPAQPASLHGLSSGSWRVVPASAIEDIAAQNVVQLKPIHHMWRISCIHNISQYTLHYTHLMPIYIYINKRVYIYTGICVESTKRGKHTQTYTRRHFPKKCKLCKLSWIQDSRFKILGETS